VYSRLVCRLDKTSLFVSFNVSLLREAAHVDHRSGVAVPTDCASLDVFGRLLRDDEREESEEWG
jgi:hypothetical protein